jgi:hypothetical protein
MATPTYQGLGQPVADNGGWRSRLGSVFGGGATPVYAGVGQPMSSSGGYLGGGTPGYASAPAASPTVPDDPCVTTCPIDPAELAAGKIAIVIPRQG